MITQDQYNQLVDKIVEAVPEIKQPIRLYVCEDRNYNNFVSRYGEPVMALEPEQTGLPPTLPDIRFTSKRFNQRPIRLDDIIRAFQMFCPAFLLSEECCPDFRAAKYREIIDLWDFYHNTLDLQSDEVKEFLYNLLVK